MRFGREVDPRTVQRVLGRELPVPPLPRRFPRSSETSDPEERRLAIIRLHADGWTDMRIGEYLGVSRMTVYRVLRRWVEEGVAGLADKSHAVRFEWDWLIAVHTLFMWDLLDQLGMTTALTALIDDAQRLGYQRAAADHAIRWAVTRIFLHTIAFRVESLAQTHVDEFVDTARAFAARPDVPVFFGADAQYRERIEKTTSHLPVLQVVL